MTASTLLLAVLAALAVASTTQAMPQCASHDRWTKVETRHFILVNNAGTAQAREYAKQLEWEAHALVSRQLKSIPLCLNEGLAEYFSTFQTRERSVAYGHAIGGHQAWLLEHPLMDADHLFRTDTASEEYNVGDAVTVDFAHDAILEGVFGEAYAAANAGRYAEAESLGAQVLNEARNPPMQDNARRLLNQLKENNARRSVVDRYNQGAAAANAGRYEEALRMFEEVSCAAGDSALVRRAARSAIQPREVIRKHGGSATRGQRSGAGTAGR